jgi:gamma-glutamylcyclotransferase (GGCT)/AIG2-like uncharacterized protein YtfP
VIPAPPLRAGDVLAVYGLLLSGAQGLDIIGARDRVTVVGPCTIPGHLIDLGVHPALVSGDGRVAGELIRVGDIHVGRRLDDFEDFLRHDPARSRYLRVLVELVAPRRRAWVYVWNGPADAGARIADGDWLAHAQRSGAVRRSGSPARPRRPRRLAQ